MQNGTYSVASAGVWVLAAALTTASTLNAQTAPAANRYGATSDSGLRSRYFTEFAHVLPSTLRLGGTEFGDVTTSAAQVSYQASLPLNASWSLLGGVELKGTWFDVPGAAPIPEALYETSLRAGALWRLNDFWSFQVLLSPGLYSDFRDIDGGDFNVPGLGLAFWQITDTLQLIAGAGVNVRRDTPVIPALGARWRFADRWTLQAVYPAPRIEFDATDAVTLFVGAELVRSAYRVAEDFGTRLGNPELNDQDLSYNEWRVGAGARWTISRAFALSVDSGWMGKREFNFDDRDVELESKGAPYFQISLSGGF